MCIIHNSNLSLIFILGIYGHMHYESICYGCISNASVMNVEIMNL